MNMRPGRRVVLGIVCCVVLLAASAAAWVGNSWKRAADDMDAMVLPTVVLPTSTPESTATSAATSVAAVPTATVAPTAVPKPDAPVTLLLLGTDARVGQDISRTDAIVVVHIDPGSNHVSMLSLPRDLWVSIPGYGKNKINAAYPIGEKKFGAGGGAALAKQTVSDLLKLPIDHFVLINFEGFQALIDKLGGITIDVAKPITDPAYPTDAFEGDTRTMQVHFDAGVQEMDGTRALIYARTRHADNDFGRNQRQQQVLMAVFDKIRSRGLLSQLTSLDDYTSSLRDYIRFDMSHDDMLSLASLAPSLSKDSIQRYAVDAKMVKQLPNSTGLQPDARALQRIVQEMTSDTVAGLEQPSTQP